MAPVTTIEHPFDDEGVEEIRLVNPPIVAVLFQIRFPVPVSQLGNPDKLDQLGEILASPYPYVQEQPVVEILIQPGQAPQQKVTNHRTRLLQDPTRNWTLSVSNDSFSLATTSYDSRQDFLNRSGVVFDAISQVFSPPPISRIGLRYINRVVGEERIKSMAPHLTDEASQVLRFIAASTDGRLRHSLSDMLYQWSNGKQIQTRWGLLPEGVVHDGTVPVVRDLSWILDIDAFLEADQTFSPGAFQNTLRDLATRAYRMFRWVVKPDGLKELDSQ